MNWFTIPNYDKYEITKTGQVRHRKHKRILKYSKTSNGYLQVAVYSNILQKPITKCVHQLMAITFLGIKPAGYEVSFIKKDKSNLNLSNLTYKLLQNNRRVRVKPIVYCVFCGCQCTSGRTKYCSNKHRFLHTHTLLQCNYCKCWFYRENGTIHAATTKHGYGKGRTYCNAKHYHLDQKRDADKVI